MGEDETCQEVIKICLGEDETSKKTCQGEIKVSYHQNKNAFQ